jgi:hypothetical protein
LERATTRSDMVRNGSPPLLNGPVEPLPPSVANRPFSTFRRF